MIGHTVATAKASNFQFKNISRVLKKQIFSALRKHLHTFEKIENDLMVQS